MDLFSLSRPYVILEDFLNNPKSEVRTLDFVSVTCLRIILILVYFQTEKLVGYVKESSHFLLS